MPRSRTDSLQVFRKSRAWQAGVLLKQLHLGLTAVVDERLQAAGLHLTRPQALALMLLVEHPGASNAEMARLGGVSPQTMHQTLARLERDGLATRRPHPRLKRVQAFEASARGADMVTRGSGVAQQAIEEVLRALRAGEQRDLVAMLERCAERLPAGHAAASSPSR